jgi:hypothetical protein
MNIETVSSSKPLPDSRPSIPTAEPPVIQLEEIQSIVYLGVKGTAHLSSAESHRVDTFA